MKPYTLFFATAIASILIAQVPSGPTNFPMVGITGAQTLRLNLVAFPPTPCGPVSLRFQNRDGVAVGPSQTTPTLQPGQSTSVSLDGSSLVDADARVELLPVVTGLNGTAIGGFRGSDR